MDEVTERNRRRRSARERLPVAGRNCWRIEPAARAAFLIDGAAYFGALRAALTEARHRIYLVGWDFNSRIRLAGTDIPDRHPESLGDLLNALVAARRGLRAYVLGWDFAMLYALDREWLPIYRLGWRTHRRLRFHLDDRHPPGGSHHQKIAVIDDRLAFVGGLDLTASRWDTPEHRADDPRRRNPDGERYPPFHDLQMAVDGKAAAAIGELARDRWQAATGTRLTAPPARDDDLWPAGVATDLRDVPVAIARTRPAYEDQSEVREVEQLWLDAIGAARHTIYIENQYFTADRLGAALIERLSGDDPPEVIVVQPRLTDGWLSQQTMDVLRARLVRRLRAADRHGRFRIYYPHVPGLGEAAVNVHAKLLIVDDRLVRIGSANLNNRSMGLDTECDLVVDAGDDADNGAAIVSLRRRLLAEHLGVDPERVAASERDSESLGDAIERLRSDGRSLRPLAIEDTAKAEALIEDTELIDPERPIDADRLADRFVPHETRRPAGLRIVLWTLFLVTVFGLAAAWRWTALGDWLTVDGLTTIIDGLRTDPLAPLWVLGGYLVGGLLVVPVTVMIAATVVAFGSFAGFGYALAGALASAVLTYAIGHKLGRGTVRRLAGSRLNRLSQRLAKRGLLAIVVVRVVPVAPFTVVNLVAGASHIRFRDYLLGTLIGMAPGILAVTAFIDRLLAVVRRPDTETVLISVGVVVAIVLAAFGLRRWVTRRSKARQASGANGE